MTSSSGARTGSLRRRIWSISVKIAVFAPMPSASDRIATMEKRGLRRSPRTANRMSLKTRVIGGLDGAPPPRVGVRTIRRNRRARKNRRKNIVYKTLLRSPRFLLRPGNRTKSPRVVFGVGDLLHPLRLAAEPNVDLDERLTGHGAVPVHHVRPGVITLAFAEILYRTALLLRPHATVL